MGGLGSLSEDDIELIESDTSKPSTETLNKVHEESMKVVEEAQQTNKELYKIDDNFFSFNEVIFIMKNKINNISSPDDLSQYSDWIKLNRDGVKSFIDDHKNEYMELSELAQQKHNKYKVAK
jgi:arsenate reductase-like glutaredoxin family protein